VHNAEWRPRFAGILTRLQNISAPEFRTLGHQVVDLLAEYFEHIEDLHVFPDIEPRLFAELLDKPLPADPEPAQAVLAVIEQKMLSGCTHVGQASSRPRHVAGSPNPIVVSRRLSLLGAQPESWRLLYPNS